MLIWICNIMQEYMVPIHASGALECNLVCLDPSGTCYLLSIDSDI
jgi:hypothetical protein